MKHIVYIFIIICLLSVIVSNNKKIEPTIITKTDTITLYDTITIEKPIPKYIKTKPDTVYIPSIDSNIVLDIETKVYKDSTYEASVTGYKSTLDWIKIYKPTTEIIKEKVIYKNNNKINISLSSGYGYGVIHKQGDLFIGLTVSVPLTNF